jgi:aldose 1-epimerase
MSSSAAPCVPSGEQYEIRSGDLAAVAVEVGGGLRELRLGDRPLLAGYPPDQMCDGARGQLLVPWPNRIAGGRYSFLGDDLQLPLTEPENGAAIHGLLRWANFSLVDRTADSLQLGYRLHPQDGWPFRLDFTVGYTVRPGGLTVRMQATNSGDGPCPYGAGAHPYLHPAAPSIDQCELELPADVYFDVDEQKIPTGRRPVAGTTLDFRRRRSLAGVQLDRAYTGLRRDGDGRARTYLFTPGGRLALWVDEQFDYLEVFTGDSLPDPSRRRTGLGLEPMTCAPDAYRNGDGLVRLAPGETHVGSWGIEVGDG